MTVPSGSGQVEGHEGERIVDGQAQNVVRVEFGGQALGGGVHRGEQVRVGEFRVVVAHHRDRVRCGQGNAAELGIELSAVCVGKALRDRSSVRCRHVLPLEVGHTPKGVDVLGSAQRWTDSVPLRMWRARRGVWALFR